MKKINIPEWIDKLPEIVKTSNCRSDVLRKLNLTTDGSGNHRVIKRWIEKLNISTSHFNYRKVLADKLSAYKNQTRYKPEEFLIENWLGSMSPIKQWAKKHIKYECNICQNNGIHNNLPLSLQLDHINGIVNNNTIQNLRWLCPNCHTQTKTYGSKKLNLNRVNLSTVNPNWRNLPKLSTRKVIRPSKEILEKEILEFPMTKLGLKYGVSDNSIRKWCKSYEINF